MTFFLFQLLLVLIVLLAAFGNDGLRLTFGVEDFLGVGASFGLAIVVPLILFSYLLGGSLFAMVSHFAFYYLLCIVARPIVFFYS